MSKNPDHSKLAILIDHREEGGPVTDALRRLDDLELRVGHLKTGDYLVGGTCVIERKTIPDFARSIVDARLFRQARRLANLPGPVALVLEGRSADLQPVGVGREAMQGAMITVSVLFGVPVLRATTPDETAQFLRFTAEQLRRRCLGVWPRRGHQPRDSRRLQLHILQGLPGIGPGRADRLLDCCGSVRAVMCAAPDQLAMVPGVGRHIAGRIADILGADTRPASVEQDRPHASPRT